MKIFLHMVIVMMIAGLASCNTWEAFKEDTNEVGRSVEKAAKKTAEDINQAE